MNRIVIALLVSVFALSIIPNVEAFNIYNSRTATYQGVPAWQPWGNSWGAVTVNNYQYQRWGRQSGYALTPRSNAPNRFINGYCESPKFVGHTSIWTQGRYYSGFDGMQRTNPSFRPQAERCQNQFRTQQWITRW